MTLQEVKEQHEIRLMGLPNVVGVGIGEKDGQPVIKVFVTRKVAEASLNPQEIIPKHLGQYLVDVEEIGKIVADAG